LCAVFPCLLLMLLGALCPSLLRPALLASCDRRLLLLLSPLLLLTRATSPCSGALLLPTAGKGVRTAGTWLGRPSTSLLECLLGGTAVLPAPAATALLLLLLVVVLLLLLPLWRGADLEWARAGLPPTSPAAAAAALEAD
jgi:hypothetical protein